MRSKTPQSDCEECLNPALRIAPIHQEAQCPSPFLVLSLTVPTAVLVLAGLSSFNIQTERFKRPPTAPEHYVSLNLNSWSDEPPRPPTRAAAPEPSPIQGQGHKEGTGTIDPHLLQAKSTLISAEAIVPLNLKDTSFQPSRDAELHLAAVRKDLPLAQNGNGLPKGNGTSLGTGTGASYGAQTTPTAAVDTEELLAIKMVRAQWSGSAAKLQSVRVEIHINSDGSVILAKAVSGPEQFRSCSESAALEWRFYVPRRLHAQCPIQRFITFTPDNHS